MGITHSTPADGTFSATGSTAWNAEHTLSESGGQALTVGAVADGEFVKRSGTALIGATPSGNSDLYASDAPNSDFDITNGGVGGAVTIISKSIAGISAGDQIEIELSATILNNSGSARTYTWGAALGAFAISNADATALNASATDEAPRRLFAVVSVSAANNARWYSQTSGSAITPADTPANQLAGGTRYIWDSSSSDFTGTQTLVVTISSSATNTTQTLRLHRYTIKKISSNP